jgi:hypothetical protein
VNENLAKARAAARADQPAPLWRVVITDSESPTGLAPVCSGERSDALHMIDDYPGGPQRDEDGVYDCCPRPQIETYSTVWAEYLVELLNADAEEKASAQAPTATPDFFQPGHTYTREHHGHRIKFVVEHVTTAPSDGYQIAFGWRNAFGWPEAPFHSDDLDGWTDTTDTTTGDTHMPDQAEQHDDYDNADFFTASELHDMDQADGFRLDAEDDAHNTAAVEAEERGDAG